ncbi:LOW QUALITY PROTEIN: myc-associated zinc finger protein-like [Melospiza melodia melodia]|uniref:LOW QUALITY PROTEIN: myc-associated zinc finger protein-like n=1 Tax=Melospiza melodia melodia TaxID=1914991 RepID=UPI002FD0E783
MTSSPATSPPVTSSPVTSSSSSRKGKGAPYVCGLCAKEFKNGYNLRRHQATHGVPNAANATKRAPRPSPTLLPLPQELLDAPQGEEGAAGGGGDDGDAAAKRTAASASARKSHACDTCGKAFRDVYHLKRHRLSHTDERPFQCPVCQQRFKRKDRNGDRMASHVRSHQGHVHKPYACGHCGKSFSRPDHLNSHVRQVHSTERPFKCQTCEAAFATRDRLRAHAVRHEDKVPCHVCGKLLSAAYVSDHLRVQRPRPPRAGHAQRWGRGRRGKGEGAGGSGCPAPSPSPAPAPPPPLDGTPGGSQGW